MEGCASMYCHHVFEGRRAGVVGIHDIPAGDARNPCAFPHHAYHVARRVPDVVQAQNVRRIAKGRVRRLGFNQCVGLPAVGLGVENLLEMPHRFDPGKLRWHRQPSRIRRPDPVFLETVHAHGLYQIANALAQKGLVGRIAEVGGDALSMLVVQAERIWQPVGVRHRHPEQHMPAVGVLGGNECLHIRPFLLIDIEGAIALLPFVVDHDGAHRQVALLQLRYPGFVVLLRRLRVGRPAIGRRFGGLLRPSTKDRQVMPVHVRVGWLRPKSALANPFCVVIQGVERAPGKMHGCHR